ncbi:hypothetical protein L7F22_033681 [Adiantum nelumboides]|nr:hypothetical protein [Adiantum nelumboides]
MHEEGVKPNSVTCECIIRACSSLDTADEGNKIFADLAKLGLYDSYVWVALVRMFCNFGSLNDARKVFSTSNVDDVVSWTVLITGHAEQGHGEEALRLYESMQKGGTKPDEAIFVCLLKICSQLGAVEKGKIIYFDILLEGLDFLLCVKQSIMDMYLKCACLEDVCALFESLPIRDVVSCSAIIAGYALHGYDTQSLKLFDDMQMVGIQPNQMTYTSIIKACASLKKLGYGKITHHQLVILGYESDDFIRSTLIDMYSSCRRVEEAWSVFNKLPRGNDVVLWNTMIGVCVEHDCNEQALELYEQMCHQGLGLGYVTLLWLMKACSDIEQGRLMHALAVKQGFDKHTEVQNTVIAMYSKMGGLGDAHVIFQSLMRRTLGSYNALLRGLSCFSHFEIALQIYHQMNEEGVQHDRRTFMLMLKICATLTNLYIGRLIYTAIAHNALECEPFLVSALLDFFAKTGSLRDAINVFNRLSLRDAASWNTLVAAYADNGWIEEAQESLTTMQEEGVEPGGRTFSCLLNASSHAGITLLSYYYFQSMRDYGIVSSAQHFACLIDALGRAGLLDEAKMVASVMPMDPSVVAWTTLLGSWSKHGSWI